MANAVLYVLRDFLQKTENKFGFQTKLRWWTVLSVGGFHIFGFYWCYLYAFPVKWQTVVFAIGMFLISGTGITCGVHRLFAHASYKARLPLRIYLMLSFSSCGQNSIYDWVRDHRCHHKFSDTEADPHNVNRGLFFSHLGWLMLKKNNAVLEKGRLIDMSDMERDPVVMFQRKYTFHLKMICCYILPTLTGVLLWGETLYCAIAWQCFIRVLLVLHSEMTVNSLAHIYGYKPYNKNIMPTQNAFVTAVTLGEGYHNYHHVFPNDYKASEFYDVINLSSFIIRTWAKIGLAYDLKEASPELVMALKKRQGADNLVKNQQD